MAKKKRVAAHFMHEKERAVAEQTLEDMERASAFLIGVCDETAIAKMRKQGLIIEVLEDVPAENPRRRDRRVRAGLAHARPSEPKPAAYPAHIEVRVTGPLTGERHSKLTATGASVIERQTDDSLLLSVNDGNQLRNVRQLKFIGNVVIQEPTTPPAPARTVGVSRTRGFTGGGAATAGFVADTGVRFVTADDAGFEVSDATDFVETEPASVHDVLIRAGTKIREVREWLKQKPGAAVVGSGKRKLRVLVGPKLAKQLSRLPGVELVSEVRPRKLRNDVARELTRSTEVKIKEPGGNLRLTGKGEMVAVADSGIDASHPDFKNRIVAVEALGRKNDATDFHGHGTHVAGTILSDGKASKKKYRGVAPAAKLYFQSLMDENGGLGGLPIDLSELFEKPYSKGARIHNNSWGAALYGRFTVDSLEVDRFVAEHPDMLIVIAAGNEGSLRASEDFPRQTPADEVELLSIGAPATSKNGLIVGASRSKRKRGGFARYTHGEVWPDDFGASTGVSVEKVSGDANNLAGFSSRGPCDDARTKPDLVAPGSDILSTRSKDAPSSNFWGTLNAHGGKYAYMGGTSMATPHVSGCAALVREYYRRKRGVKKPSAALLKATLINGCRWLSGSGAVAIPNGEPNFHQGFGCIDLSQTLPESDAGFRLAYVDTWRDPSLAMNIDDRHRWEFVLKRKQDLRICFAYTDHPARSLQNVFYILVEEPAGGSAKHFGNEHAPKGAIVGPDTNNNVEVVRIPNAKPGKYLIQVAARGVLHPGQHYALVIGGSLGKNGDTSPADSPYSKDFLRRIPQENLP